MSFLPQCRIHKVTEVEGKTEKLYLDQEIIVFVGPEGAGKTTQAKKLAQDSGSLYLTTGEILRDLAANDNGPLGDRCRAMFAAHEYLDGETLLQVLKHRLNRRDTANGFILDGGLRTLPETTNFQSVLEEAGRAFPVTVIHLRIPGWLSFERLVLGEEARKRVDDTYEGVAGRLAKYYYQLNERIGTIEKQPSWKLVHFNATESVDQVYEAVCAALGTNR